MELFVSIIIPVYNVERYLSLCIDSIKKQTYSHFEGILIDDGSTDGSGALCDRIADEDKRFSVIHKENGGLSSARNSGISVAKGDYICFIDSDDWVNPDYIEKLMCFAIKQNADVVSCRFKRDYKRIIDCLSASKNDRCRLKYLVFEGDSAISHYLKSAVRGGVRKNDISCCTKLYKKSAIGTHRFREGMIYEDVVFNSEVIASIRKYVWVDYKGYHYYVNRNSITTEQSYSDKVFDLDTGASLIEKSLAEKKGVIHKELMQYKAKVHVSILSKLLKMKGVNKKVLKCEIDRVKSDFFLNMKSSISLSGKILLICLEIIPTVVLLKTRK